MQVMLLKKPKKIRQKPLGYDVKENPKVSSNDLLLKVLACAVCRTDLQLVEGDIKARRLPIIPGHQIVGIVENVGNAVQGWKVGDKAGVGWLAETCGKCSFCKEGRENLCVRAKFTGWDSDGGYAEFVLARADFALKVPSYAKDAEIAPLLCGGIIGYRALLKSGIKPGGRLGLFGYGSSANLAIQVARHWGCKVYVFTRSKQGQKRALSAGAVWVGGYDKKPPVLLDAAVTFSPTGDAVVAALRSIKRGSKVAINAIHLDRVPEFSYDLLWGEKELVSVSNYTRKDAQEFLKLASEIRIKTEIETFPLKKANEALLNLSLGKPKGTPVLIPPSFPKTGI